MDCFEIVKKAFELKNIPYENIGGSTLATNLPNGRTFFVMCINDEIEIGLSRTNYYKRIDARRTTIAGRKSVSGIDHIEYNGTHGEPMFGTAIKAIDATVPEMSKALDDLLKNLNDAMDNFDKYLHLR